MSEERKKIEKKPAIQIIPKAREGQIIREPKTEEKESKTEEKETKPKTNKSDITFVKIDEDADQKVFVEMGEKVQKGEAKWSFYALDGNKGCHYYTLRKTVNTK